MAGGTPPREGKRPSDGSWEDGTSTSQKPNSSRKRCKRRNTDTEALAHLHPLQDYLKEGLDGACYILLCIIIFAIEWT